MKLRLLLLTIIICCCANISSAQLYTFRNYNHRDGLTMASTSSLAQSKDGYLWIGTDGGPLMRFNGKTFKEIIVKGDDNNHHVQNLIIEGDSILFASKYKGVFSYSIEENRYSRFNVSTKVLGEAIALLKDKGTHYIIGSKSILTEKKGNIQSLIRFEGKIKLHHFTKMKKGFIVFTSQGNFILNNGKISSLSRFLNTNSKDANSFKFGYVHSDRLILFNAEGSYWLEALLDNDGNFLKKRMDHRPVISEDSDKIISFNSIDNNKNIVVVTQKGQLYHIRDRSLYRIAHNYNKEILNPEQIISDLNGDYWIASSSRGIYKVSLESFTKIQLHPVYESTEIAKPYRTIYDDIFISTFTGKTYVGRFDSDEFSEFPFIIRAVTLFEGTYYLATNVGIKKFSNNGAPKFEDVLFKNENVTLIMSDKGSIWAGVAGKGIIKIDINKAEQIHFRKKQKLPLYFYTGQATSKYIYFGTNNGIFKYNKKSNKFSRCKYGANLGSYSGCSTKDVHGTLWFTMEKGIVGFLANGKTKVLRGDDYFKTNLYFTLNSDKLGNVMIGTNKGLTVLHVNRLAEVMGKTHYDANSGFGGYETHMRSDFQRDNNIFVGTVEGLFLINTDIMDQVRTPLAPVVTDLTRYESNGNVSSFHFSFHVNNPKIGKIRYSYRVIGGNEKWTDLDEENSVQLYDLTNGNYTLEVRASHDGVNYSAVTRHNIKVELPIWKTNWFLILIVVCVVGVNLMLINYSRTFDRNSLVKTKDAELHLLMTPNIIILGIVAVAATHIFAPLVSSELELHLPTVLSVIFFLMALFFMSKSAIGTGNEHLLNRYLLVGVGVIMLHSYYEMYVSNLHPFHIIGLVLTTMVMPFFLHRIKSMIIFASLILLATLIIVIIVRNEVYPKSYFIIANIALITLLVFLSYLRSDSLDKLIFISSIINRGSIPALAFDQEGSILYSSENISKFVDAKHTELVNKNISILNSFIPFEGQFREVDVLKEFKDGEKYLVPMVNAASEVRWLEWEYKDFSPDIKVMLGQDVTAKMELENTYELLVQNAEDFIYRCDIHGNFVFLNDVCYAKMGYGKEDLIGKHSISIVPQSHHEEVAKYYSDHFNERSAASYKEFPILKKNGEIVWIGQYVTTLYAPGSTTHINGFIALARDITEIRLQQKLIKDQRDDITSSINYARRIQFNLLPHERNFASNFKEYFIIYKPKDIVSGDFYWMEKIGTKTILVLADCTGHGVPGSFMTLLGINLLNSVVLEGKLTDPGDILNELDRRLVDILPRGSGDTAINDAMEMTVCVFDNDSKELAYGCAGSRFLIFENKSFTMLKGDSKHIGDAPTEEFQSYSTHYTPFTEENNLYLFTDGFQDQFGGENDKKFSFRRILELFEEIVDLPAVKQRVEIEHEFDEWIGDGDQTDDVTIISIKKNII